jgi:hypothetical protein
VSQSQHVQGPKRTVAEAVIVCGAEEPLVLIMFRSRSRGEKVDNLGGSVAPLRSSPPEPRRPALSSVSWACNASCKHFAFRYSIGAMEERQKLKWCRPIKASGRSERAKLEQMVVSGAHSAEESFTKQGGRKVWEKCG